MYDFTLWVKLQLDEAGYIDKTDPVRQLILELSDVWSRYPFDKTRAEAGALFTRLITQKALEARSPERWVPSKQFGRLNAIMRVRLDAYAGDKGMMLNGRRGTAVGMRRGEVVLLLSEPASDGSVQVRDDITMFETLLN